MNRRSTRSFPSEDDYFADSEMGSRSLSNEGSDDSPPPDDHNNERPRRGHRHGRHDRKAGCVLDNWDPKKVRLAAWLLGICALWIIYKLFFS
ncbi:hypothetical protein IscW_ISCW023686 [Ixodes scapularis]|uniref:Uncharacterized protein n=1 Tax=Ixodes scapularis TaxID=6945 RepID=B7QIE0_IXOSC|nr:hypothetical protein IscW_ISCW023686 [Ixodes scapularis]|eukprot:XP_002414947.1 hypothetical protein IscW_ISCW023686 [Ixodes scapularis]